MHKLAGVTIMMLQVGERRNRKVVKGMRESERD